MSSGVLLLLILQFTEYKRLFICVILARLNGSFTSINMFDKELRIKLREQDNRVNTS